jgi:hypothetical protein
MKNENLYRDLNNFDVVAKVEELHGQRIDDSTPKEIVLELLTLQGAKNVLKEQLLLDANDTTFGMDALPYLQIVKDLGFIEVYTDTFPHVWEGEEARDYTETHYVLANPEIGAVLNFDTYSYQDSSGKLAVHRNGATLQYCWQPKDLAAYPNGVLSSGGWESKTDPEWRNQNLRFECTPDLFWFGSHDAREGLRFIIKNLMDAGTMLPVWPSMTRSYWLPFINWSDWKVCDYKTTGSKASSDAIHALNNYRYRTTPEWFKAMTGHNVSV